MVESLKDISAFLEWSICNAGKQSEWRRRTATVLPRSEFGCRYDVFGLLDALNLRFRMLAYLNIEMGCHTATNLRNDETGARI